MTPTREEIAEAMGWRHLRYIVSPESLADLDTYHDPDEVDENIETLQALCRMLNEALRDVLHVYSSWASFHPAMPQEFSSETMATINLMPKPKEDT